jgi:hypothetical protein
LVPGTNKLLAQRLKVVGLPIVNDPDILFGIAHRHMAGSRKVYDAQAVGAETDMIEGYHAIVVWTAVRLKRAHSADKARMVFFTASSRQADQSGNCTHVTSNP